MQSTSIGSVSIAGTGGRIGVIVGATPVGPSQDGKQTYSIRMRTIDGRSDPAAPPDPAAPARFVSKPLPHSLDNVSGATREPKTAEPRIARDPAALTAEEKAAVDQLRTRDQQVRQEEKAHAAAAGDLAGPISYTYATGPDGRQYAVGGSVAVSAQTVTGDPEEAARKGARLAHAANAAHNPSAADLQAARAGYAFAAQAGESAQYPGLSVAA